MVLSSLAGKFRHADDARRRAALAARAAGPASPAAEPATPRATVGVNICRGNPAVALSAARRAFCFVLRAAARLAAGGGQGRTWCTPTPCTFH